MGGHTILNLKEVEDMAPKFGFAPDLEARFAAGDLGLENSGLSYQRLAPNFRMPFGHKHKQQEEVYVVLAGGGRVKLDDEAARVPPFRLLPAPVPKPKRASRDSAVGDRHLVTKLLERCPLYEEIAEKGLEDSVYLQRDLEEREELARL